MAKHLLKLLNRNAAAVSLHIILQSDLIFMMFSAVIILEFSTSNSEFDCSFVTRDKANVRPAFFYTKPFVYIYVAICLIMVKLLHHTVYGL